MTEKSKISKAQQKAVQKYVKKNYDRIELNVTKGQKDFISQQATAAGESVNGYIKKAVEERIQRENPDISLTSQTTE